MNQSSDNHQAPEGSRHIRPPAGEGRFQSARTQSGTSAEFLRSNANPQNDVATGRCERALGAPVHSRVRVKGPALPKPLKMSINQFAHEAGRLRAAEVREWLFAGIDSERLAGAKFDDLAASLARLQSQIYASSPTKSPLLESK